MTGRKYTVIITQHTIIVKMIDNHAVRRLIRKNAPAAILKVCAILMKLLAFSKEVW